MMMILLFLSAVSLFFSQSDYQVASPNAKIIVKVEIQNQAGSTSETGALYYHISYVSGGDTTTVIEPSRLGLQTTRNAFSEDLSFTDVSAETLVKEHYRKVHGKTKWAYNEGHEKVFYLENADAQKMEVIIRAYNDGVAFRYTLPGPARQNHLLESELSTFTIPEGSKRWTQSYSKDYEGFYELSTDGRGHNDNTTWTYPALVEISNGLFTLITEADNDMENSATRLINERDGDIYNVTLPSPRDNFQQDGTQMELPWSSPWRVLMIGSLGDVVESTLVTDVSKPSKIEQTDWIKPGAAAWIY